ncbi:type II toxin-antitoxin system PemK/MazF family toxin [Anaerobacillus sp. MEB173]|uniref:type II toxin-antitoxin system PemK/MazF family toxin n=1 Tax=Anaerobacillus sp. MEB173 TaxID=3383345 RepID=UPI003F8F0C17
MANKYSDKVIVCIIDIELQNAELPTHLPFSNKEFENGAVIKTDEIMPVRKERLLNKISRLTDEEQIELKNTLQITLQIVEF